MEHLKVELLARVVVDRGQTLVGGPAKVVVTAKDPHVAREIIRSGAVHLKAVQRTLRYDGSQNEQCILLLAHRFALFIEHLCLLFQRPDEARQVAAVSNSLQCFTMP